MHSYSEATSRCGSPRTRLTSRRSQHLEVALHRTRTKEPIHLVVDSTGLSIVGEGEWAAARHGGRGKRGWKKLHLGVDGSGVIVAQVLTDGNADDAGTALALMDELEGNIESFTADTAYDTSAIYDAAGARGAKVIVPPTRMATRVRRRRPGSNARDGTIKRVREIGRRRWKKESGYHRQGTVENAFYRYESIIGDRLRPRTSDAQAVEARLASIVLNRMFELGRPTSVAIGR